MSKYEWTLPKHRSSQIRRGSRRLLARADDLFHAYQRSHPKDVRSAQQGNLRIQFDTCIGLVEARDFIRRLMRAQIRTN
jgi:hypothetical protein